MRSTAIWTAATLVAASTMFGAVGPKYADWCESPVKHLMTREEMKQCKALKSDDEAKAFVDLFWAKRDPTPDTPRNEYKEEFDRRVDVADKQFTSPKLRGALSDPGKVLILLGMPYEIHSKGSSASKSTATLGGTASTGAATAPTDTAGGLLLPSATEQRQQQIWWYAHERKPKFIPQTDFQLVFEDYGHNELQLAHTEKINPDLVLNEAVKFFIVSPNLTKPPFTSEATVGKREAFTNTDLKTAFYLFKNGDKPGVGPADLTWGEFVSPEGIHYVAASLYAPAGSGIQVDQNVTLFSVLEDKTGQVIEVHEDAAKMVATGSDAYVDTTLDIEPGDYTMTFGLADGGKMLSARRIPIKVVGLDPKASDVSPLILSNNIQALQSTWDVTAPFTFGGLKVVPKGDGSFQPKGDLWYFIEVRNPGLNEQKAPSVQVAIEITGKTAKGPATMKLPLAQADLAPLKGEKDRYAVGLAIPLEGFKPGEYTMKVHLVDTVLSKKYELEKPFRIAGM